MKTDCTRICASCDGFNECVNKAWQIISVNFPTLDAEKNVLRVIVYWPGLLAVITSRLSALANSGRPESIRARQVLSFVEKVDENHEMILACGETKECARCSEPQKNFCVEMALLYVDVGMEQAKEVIERVVEEMNCLVEKFRKGLVGKVESSQQAEYYRELIDFLDLSAEAEGIVRECARLIKSEPTKKALWDFVDRDYSRAMGLATYCIRETPEYFEKVFERIAWQAKNGKPGYLSVLQHVLLKLKNADKRLSLIAVRIVTSLGFVHHGASHN